MLRHITLTDRLIVDKQLDSTAAAVAPDCDLLDALLDDNRASSLTFIAP